MYLRPRSIWYRKNWWCSGVKSSLALITCRQQAKLLWHEPSGTPSLRCFHCRQLIYDKCDWYARLQPLRGTLQKSPSLGLLLALLLVNLHATPLQNWLITTLQGPTAGAAAVPVHAVPGI